MGQMQGGVARGSGRFPPRGGARGFAYLVTLFSFIAYYVAGRLGVALAEKHVPAVLAAFLPNLMVLAIGVVLSARLARRGVPLVRG